VGGDATPVFAVILVADEAPVAGGMYMKETWPTELVARPLTLAKGQVEIHVDALINLSKDAVFKPFAIAPDIYYGVNDKLTVGLTHGLGLCLTGTDNGCAKVYNDIGVDALYSLKRDAKMDLAANVGFAALAFSPDLVGQVHLGVHFKYQANKIAIYVDPTLGIGVTQRDAGNKEVLSIPIKVAYQASPQLAAYLMTGLGGIFPTASGPTAGGLMLDPPDPIGIGDTYGIPLGIGAQFAVKKNIDVGANFMFPLIAGSDAATADARFLTVFANLRF